MVAPLRSFLSDRPQLVAVHGVTSHPDSVFSGVPQGSVLVPLLFLFYVNDLCLFNFTSNSSLVLYADDTTLYKPLSQPSNLSDFQADINTIHNWFSSYQLTAKAAKTKSMVISTKKNPFPDMILHLNNQPIERFSSAKFLGNMDHSEPFLESPGWSYLQESSQNDWFIHQAFHSAPVSTGPILYLALVRPMLEYGSTTWHPLNKNPYQPLWIMSKICLPGCPSVLESIWTPVPWIPLFAVSPCPRDHFIHMPLRFGTTSQRKLSSAGLCHPSRRLFIPVLCDHCLSHLVLFCPV